MIDVAVVRQPQVRHAKRAVERWRDAIPLGWRYAAAPLAGGMIV